jgi:predicted  nucleic acid-binding Zn-ribbon protein
MGMQLEELIAEVNRLRHLDKEHRKISEEAEAQTRDIKHLVRKYGTELEELTKKIQRWTPKEGLESEWARYHEILLVLTHL